MLVGGGDGAGGGGVMCAPSKVEILAEMRAVAGDMVTDVQLRE